MMNVNVERLARLKNIEDYEMEMKFEQELNDDMIQDTKSYVDNNFFERRKKYLDIESYFESRLHGLSFNIYGGGKKRNGDER